MLLLMKHAFAAAALAAIAGADCPDGCPAKCPAQDSVQSDTVKNNFDLNKFWGTFYEIAFHDSTQPTMFPIEAKCQRSVKSPKGKGNYKDLFSLNEGYFAPGGKGVNPVCDLEFNITDKPGVFMGHWHSSSPWNPGLSNIANTLVDVGVAENGTYEWTLEFQCKEYDAGDKKKGIRFAAVNFYHRKPIISDTEFNEMKKRLAAQGLGWIMKLDKGLHMVDQKQCIDHDSYPAVNASANRWCGQSAVRQAASPLAVDVAKPEVCPSFLKPLCSIVKSGECLASCMPRLKSCILDADCRDNMKNFGLCMVAMKKKNATADEVQSCLVPDNEFRSEFIYCIMDGGEKGACVDVPVPPSTYPACADTKLVGDPKFDIKGVVGDWYKVVGWSKGELVECLPCQTVKFWEYNATTPLPWPAPLPPAPEDYKVIESTWHEQDSKGKYWPMKQTSLWGPRKGRQGFPAKEFSTGTMFGIGYKEDYTVVHDGSKEAEPFVFLYACGATKQGEYVSGLVLAKDPTPSATLRAKIDKVAKDAGFVPSEWCNVDNSCFKNEPAAAIII